MKAELKELYQQVILDHNKNPRNFHDMPDATHEAEGYNPLCGDKVHLYLKIENDRIADVSFTGVGCAISKASASLMTMLLKGRTVREANRLFELFHGLVTGELDPEAHADELDRLVVFYGVRDFPTRIKCATLAWHAFQAALENKKETVSTE
ncbi:MAG: SUF system NifU family Fe-S cluster assembly protein [Calditrichaeota bacterium]|nr:MAG: SUF system NifU family Fe-S cluster assembly protein [Calditrichota bacterium]